MVRKDLSRKAFSCDLTKSGQLTEDLEKVHSRQREESKPREGQTPHVLRKGKETSTAIVGGGRGMRASRRKLKPQSLRN